MAFSTKVASWKLATVYGPYGSFPGSPASEGKLTPDLWTDVAYSGMYEWPILRQNVKSDGKRTGAEQVQMPSASTASVMGNYEEVAPQTSNVFSRRVLTGEFMVVNKYLIEDLTALGLWSKEMRDKILAADGILQNIPEIPDRVKNVYKTSWELGSKILIDMARDRAPFICQTQSMSLVFDVPEYEVDSDGNMTDETYAKRIAELDGKINSAVFYAWQKGLKTGSYYTKIKAAAKNVQYTISKDNTTELFSTEERKKLNDSINKSEYDASNGNMQGETWKSDYADSQCTDICSDCAL
jgi:ribonucleoside-diphosphate reductase alpha chain